MSKVDEREEKKNTEHISKSVYVVNDAETHLNSNIKYMQLCWHFLFVYLLAYSHEFTSQLEYLILM